MRPDFLKLVGFYTVMALATFACAAEVDAPPDEIQTPPDCSWPASKAPVLHGFALGMSLEEVLAQFDNVPELKDLLAQNRTRSISRDGYMMLSVATAADGAKRINFDGGWLMGRVDPDRKLGTISGLDLVFREQVIDYVRLVDWQSPAWKTRSGFLAHLSETYGFQPALWKERKLELSDDDEVPEYQDYMSQIDTLRCVGFTMVSDCAGPPAPEGMCTLSVFIPVGT